MPVRLRGRINLLLDDADKGKGVGLGVLLGEHRADLLGAIGYLVFQIHGDEREVRSGGKEEKEKGRGGGRDTTKPNTGWGKLVGPRTKRKMLLNPKSPPLSREKPPKTRPSRLPFPACAPRLRKNSEKESRAVPCAPFFLSLPLLISPVTGLPSPLPVRVVQGAKRCSPTQQKKKEWNYVHTYGILRGSRKKEGLPPRSCANGKSE